MSVVNTPVPPRIPGDSALKTLEAQTLKVEDEIIVDGDITCNSLTATTTVVAGTTMTAGTGITATTGNIVATAGAVNAGTTMTAGTGITATTGNITATAGNVVATAGNITASSASASIHSNGFVSASVFSLVGAAQCGTAQLNGASGTVTVSTTAVATGDQILLTYTSIPGALTNSGTLSVSAIVNGTSFTITSSSATDSSYVNWLIARPY